MLRSSLGIVSSNGLDFPKLTNMVPLNSKLFYSVPGGLSCLVPSCSVLFCPVSNVVVEEVVVVICPGGA